LESEKSQRINQFVILIRNGEDIKTQNGLDTQLEEGDVLSFMPAIAGG
jgi:molybdopterin converting factor small subunit